MTIATEVSRISYIGAGIAGPFAVPFFFSADADLKVVKTQVSDGAETILVNVVDYAVTGAGVAAGGSILLSVALPATHHISIVRVPPQKQSTALLEAQKFPAKSVERMGDVIAVAVQRALDLATRAIRLSDGDDQPVTFTLPPKVSRANKFLSFDAAGEVKASSAIVGTTAIGILAGGIAFGDGAQLTQDVPNLYWDNVNKRLGIGTNAPTVALDVTGTIKAGKVGIGVAPSGLGVVINPGNVLGITGAGTTNVTIVAQDATSNLAVDIRNSSVGSSIFSVTNSGIVTAPVVKLTGGVGADLAGAPLFLENDRLLAWKDNVAGLVNAGFVWYTAAHVLNFGVKGNTRVQLSDTSFLPITNNVTDLGTATNLFRSGYFGTSMTTPQLKLNSTDAFYSFSASDIRLSLSSDAYIWQAGGFFPTGDNTRALGGSGNRWTSGYFSTSVITPLVGTSADALLSIAIGGTSRWAIQPSGNNYDLIPTNNDNTQSFGMPSSRIKQVFTPIIDSGTTGSLSLKTNNGTLGFQVVHNASAVNYLDTIAAPTTANPALRVVNSSDANVGLDFIGRGAGTFTFFSRGDVAAKSQFQVLDTASSTRNITVTGSNGGNPTIGVTAGNLAITPNVVLAGTLTGPATMLSPITNSLGADVLLNNVANYIDGPSIAQGSTGTWFVSGTVTLVDTGAAQFHVKLWDGTTVVASGLTQAGAGIRTTCALSGFITAPAGNLRISVKDISTVNGKIESNTTGNGKDSTITAFRIA